MNLSTAKSPANHQRIKLLVALGLAILLMVVLGRGSQPAADESQAEVSSAPAAAVRSMSGNPQATHAVAEVSGPLPEVDLPRILAQNPFLETAASGRDTANSTGAAARVDAPPARLTPSVSAASSVAFDAASSDITPPIEVSAIITGGGRPAALIGDRLCYEQDLVDGLWQITEIRPTGVVVQPVAQATPGAATTP